MNRPRRICKSLSRFLLALVILFVSAGVQSSAQSNPGTLQQGQGAPQQPPRSEEGLEVLHVQGNVYMIAGAGGNITVQIGDNVIVVDSGVTDMSTEVLAAIQKLTTKHVLFIINTSDDWDHVGGNETLSKAGWALPDSGLNPIRVDTSSLLPGNLRAGASIIAHNNLLDRMSAKDSTVPAGLLPTDTYSNDDWKLYNGEAVFITHPNNAHTNGDSYVLFRKSDVISTGDIVTLESYPVINEKTGGSITGVLNALNQILDLMVPKENEEGGTYVVPGHGRVCDRNDIANYRDMVTIVRDRVQSLIRKGMTLQQVQAAKPTLDYDPLYGTTTGSWTTNMFVEAVYRELSKNEASSGAARKITKNNRKKNGGGR